MKLLLVEDDTMLGSSLKRALEQAAYTVDWAKAGDEAIAAIAAQRYEMIVLDLTLPRVGGMEVLRQLRRSSDRTPVLILSAQDESRTKVEGLDAGADDYLVKPFDLEELLARIRSRARRAEDRNSDQLRAGEVVLDLSVRRVTLRGEPVSITGKEMKVLSLLMRRPGRLTSKQEIEQALYDGESGVESNTIETTIYTLRRKLGQGFIVTERGLGYRLA